jgi:hypothetical protein
MEFVVEEEAKEDDGTRVEETPQDRSCTVRIKWQLKQRNWMSKLWYQTLLLKTHRPEFLSPQKHRGPRLMFQGRKTKHCNLNLL